MCQTGGSPGEVCHQGAGGVSVAPALDQDVHTADTEQVPGQSGHGDAGEAPVQTDDGESPLPAEPVRGPED